MTETITWIDTKKRMPEKSGMYLVTLAPDVTAYKRLDYDCPNCVRNWKENYISWAEKPKGFVPC